MLSQITPLILTLNEEANIARTLERLAWARDIVVVDSGSTDRTREILSRFPQVRVFERLFDFHAAQWNFGLRETGIRTDWVLAMDADYVLSKALIAELGTLSPGADVAGFRASFVYCVEGVSLRGGIYPPVIVLYRGSRATYVQDGHTQRVEVQGRVLELSARIVHDDRKPVSQWLAAQARYASLECEKLLSTPFWRLSGPDRIRRLIVLAPLFMFLYCLIGRGNILDGKAGILYALQRATAEAVLSLMLLRARLTVRDGQ